jgi:hypothetical protein
MIINLNDHGFFGQCTINEVPCTMESSEVSINPTKTVSWTNIVTGNTIDLQYRRKEVVIKLVIRGDERLLDQLNRHPPTTTEVPDPQRNISLTL